MYNTRQDIENELNKHLDTNEKLYWVGQPKQGFNLKGGDWFIVIFGIFWCGFAVVWIILAYLIAGSTFFPVFGIILFFWGLFIFIGRFILDIRRRRNTIYGLTDSRVIIKSGIFSQEVKSYDLHSMSDIKLTESADGSGYITLGADNSTRYTGRSINIVGYIWLPGMPYPPMIESVDNTRTIYNQIIELKRKRTDYLEGLFHVQK
ncbi:hypothetical protein M2451_001800 [Dysgonomonas sp. PFB1-18]|uniref:PH domain-containing protein n=1 Tax=unclassified Dysgonomonas TaxID=2630389 RepID=UPI0024749CCC|nr:MULTISPECIES: PH domain-containing protein [unclassified Dysgonomonas]MDH6309229.1 hypothetical protein [Dysgonomonas sp. PF1-14]MDH6338891.1 hypothetical protein [Dysgonomonas sp. PF1-16]MDH6380478.1 hypothetical protein [Dysgonomonas sp. PFB1-18]MDH6397719.1 hypothetical protein [Dysgonomonas sp. PF1-23]